MKRITAQRAEFRTIIVFSEGKNSEPNYINGLKKLPHVLNNTALRLELHPEQGVPLTLVQMAVAEKRKPEVDECWCIFDVEWPRNHPNLQAALDLAEGHGVQLAISNPCFELWLILHHENFNTFENNDVVERKSRALDGRAGKSIDPSTYLHLRKDAARRAELLAKRHARDMTRFPHDNPSSGMYRFLRALEN